MAHLTYGNAICMYFHQASDFHEIPSVCIFHSLEHTLILDVCIFSNFNTSKEKGSQALYQYWTL